MAEAPRLESSITGNADTYDCPNLDILHVQSTSLIVSNLVGARDAQGGSQLSKQTINQQYSDLAVVETGGQQDANEGTCSDFPPDTSHNITA